MKTDRLPKFKRAVIKIGSSSIATSGGEVKLSFLKDLCQTIKELNSTGSKVILVSSGAIALGRPLLKCGIAVPDLPTKQACAAAGQPMLMKQYVREFQSLGLTAAQVLLTREDFKDRSRYLNARDTFLRLLELCAVPIVNENDTVSVEEIRFGDNDSLAASVAGLTGADLLILLTDIEAVYDADPRKHKDARALHLISKVTEGMISSAGEAGLIGSGGMKSKLKAAKTAQQFGIPAMIAKGGAETLALLREGKKAGTWIEAGGDRLKSRKRWIAHALKPSGEIKIDAGAAKAVRHGGRSLLPKGVIGIHGKFQRGDMVEIKCEEAGIVGRGLVRYSAGDVEKICGHQSGEIKSILGYSCGDEIIHRDDLVIDK